MAGISAHELGATARRHATIGKLMMIQDTLAKANSTGEIAHSTVASSPAGAAPGSFGMSVAMRAAALCELALPGGVADCLVPG